MYTRQELIEEIKSLLIDSDGYWEDVVWGLVDYEYGVTYITSQALDKYRWVEDTLYIYRLEKDNETINMGIVVREGLTENQEDEGIVLAYEVIPRTIERTIWEKSRDEIMRDEYNRRK